MANQLKEILLKNSRREAEKEFIKNIVFYSVSDPDIIILTVESEYYRTRIVFNTHISSCEEICEDISKILNNSEFINIELCSDKISITELNYLKSDEEKEVIEMIEKAKVLNYAEGGKQIYYLVYYQGEKQSRELNEDFDDNVTVVSRVHETKINKKILGDISKTISTISKVTDIVWIESQFTNNPIGD